MLKAAFARMTEVFSPSEIMQGKEIVQRGQVLNCRFSEGLIRARVKGDVGQLYDVYLDLKAWPSPLSRCACGQIGHCQHAAACLFALQDVQAIAPQKPLLIESEPFIRSNELVREEVIEGDEVEWFSERLEQGYDFFTYQLGILVDGQPIDLVPIIAHVLRRWDVQTLEQWPDDRVIRLPIVDHKVLSMPLKRLKPLLRIFVQLGQKDIDKSGMKLRHYQGALLQEAEQAIAVTRARWMGTKDFSRLQDTLRNVASLPVVTFPQALTLTLRDYQHQGLNWLQFLRQHHFSGILADDMGLGKTIQTLALILYEKEQGRLKKPCLILAPTSLVMNWMDEAKRFTPTLNLHLYYGSDRKVQFDDVDVVISTYGVIQRDKTLMSQYEFYYLILDEAQFIKNFKTKTTQVIHQMRAVHRLCLTGTPLENHLGELWSLFHFLMPGLLGTSKQFRQIFRIPIEKHQDQDRLSWLIQRVQPFILRRTKSDVLKELPAKTETVQMITLAGSQRDLYEVVRMSMEQKVRQAIESHGIQQSRFVILDALLKLRQVCCDPRLLSLPEASMAHGSSAKLDALMVLIENVIEEGRCALVFSQFTSMLTLIEARLMDKKYPYYKLTGQTKHRQVLVNQFQEGHVPIFLISLKAGGVGLNLTRADTIILYDPWWNPAVQEQAANRSHRIGQENPVFVYQLIATGTVEEAMLAMQATKQRLFSDLLSGQLPMHTSFTEDEISQLFKRL